MNNNKRVYNKDKFNVLVEEYFENFDHNKSEIKHPKSPKSNWVKYIDVREPEGFFTAVILGVIIGLSVVYFLF